GRDPAAAAITDFAPGRRFLGGLGRSPAGGAIPDQLRSSAEDCGFWAESAWGFHYLDPDREGKDRPAADDGWRTWKDLHVIRSSTFRHYFRYQPLGSRYHAAGAHPGKDLRGFGFLRNWNPGKNPWKDMKKLGSPVRYLSAWAD